jgi:hypothetical protein
MFPPNSPDITLVFSGLFLFAFEEENKYCQLVVAQAERHCLKINIKTQSDSLPDAPELSCKVPDGDIFFEVTGRTNGVDTYEPGPFERHSRHDERDFRWLLDFEGRELHHRQLQLRADALKRSVFVYDGLFYTHSSQGVIIKRPPSTSHLDARTIEGAIQVPQSQNALIAKSIGCDIYLDGREGFQIKFGLNAGYSINLRKEPKIHYEISVTNLCVHEAERKLAGHSDFAFYYDIINVPENQQFEILPAISPATDRDPCNPASLRTSRVPFRLNA